MLNRDDSTPLTVALGSSIELTFLDFHLEGGRCTLDFVKVLDSNEKQLWKGCGQQNPQVQGRIFQLLKFQTGVEKHWQQDDHCLPFGWQCQPQGLFGELERDQILVFLKWLSNKSVL